MPRTVWRYATEEQRIAARREVMGRARDKWREKNPNHAKSYYHANKNRFIERKREYRRGLPPETKKAWKLKYLYGLTIKEFNELKEKQKGLCAICGKPPNSRGLCVDHDHETGKVRGLLCEPCNLVLRDYVTLEWIEKCRVYLQHGI